MIGFCLARTAVIALKWPLPHPWIWIVSFLKEFEPEINCDFPATSSAWRQMLQAMLLFSSENVSHENSSFYLLRNFLLWPTFVADGSGFFLTLLQSPIPAIAAVLLWISLLGGVWPDLLKFFWKENIVGWLWLWLHSVRAFRRFVVFFLPPSFNCLLFMTGTKWLGSNQVPGRLSKPLALDQRMLTCLDDISVSSGNLGITVLCNSFRYRKLKSR